MTDTTTATDRQARIDAICAAAVPVFASQGFRGTSMADLAAAADLSRPALYQYFDNRADLFRVAFGAMLERATDAALDALARDTDATGRLDGYLQRLSGDGYEQLAATSHGDELMEAKHEFAADVAGAAYARAHAGLRRFVDDAAASTPAADRAFDLLTLSPLGLKGDHPTPAIYRTRLTSLAQASVALLDD
ncbi:MAG: helix-turn-helix domain-containing protein [Actinomycetota bacterium]